MMVSETTVPNVSCQTEFVTDDDADDDDALLEPKEKGGKATINDFFDGAAPPRERADREAKPAKTQSSLLEDRTELSGGSDIGEQERLKITVPDGQKDLSGDDAGGRTGFIRSLTDDESE
jgi:hypothetical protein